MFYDTIRKPLVRYFKMTWPLFYLLASKPPINGHELILLANELSDIECRRLVEALRIPGYSLKYEVSGESITGSAPCVELLRQWNVYDGLNKPWSHVTRRLYQIGKKKLARSKHK